MARLNFLILRPDLNSSKFIDTITGRSRPSSHQQSRVETIRVPGQDRLVLVDTPVLTGFVPPELDTIGEWLKTVYALFSSGMSSVFI